MYNFEPYNALLDISTNINVLLMTASVLQGHVYTIMDTLRCQLCLQYFTEWLVFISCLIYWSLYLVF